MNVGDDDTYLSPDHLCQSADKLGSDISVSSQGLFVNHLPHSEP